MHSAPVAHAAPAAAAPVAAPKAAAVDANVHIVKSPFVGTFYASPSPGKPVYAKVGDKVKVGQPLCVLEAMKIMNEIDSDANGEIIEICVDNESLVEYGQPLFKIKK
jgi:acetyl-CoA carboxylase biotin carboxyl carrier protein